MGVWRSADHPMLLNLETNDAVSDFLNGENGKHLEFDHHKSKAKGKTAKVTK